MQRILRRIGQTVAAAALIAGLGLAGAPSAHATSTTTSSWTIGNKYVLFSWWSMDCLDDSTDYGLRTYPCSASSQNGGWQEWKVINMYGVYGQLMNVNTGQCLDWSPQYGLRMFPCYYSSLSGGWQGWRLVVHNQADGFPVNVLQNGRYQDGEAWQCLDTSQYGVRGYPCNGTSQDNNYQAWAVSAVS